MTPIARKIIGTIHLWLGLLSGLVVFIIAITGCLYSFKHEIQNLIQPYRHVNLQNKDFLFPSRIQQIADKQIPDKQIHAVLYAGRTNAAEAIYYNLKEHYFDIVYMNPYTGEILKIKNMYDDFFSIVLEGHFYLWLPHTIGQPIVASATLLFVAMLITGLFLWWKKNKPLSKQQYKIKWNVRWRRKNYDLHNILGFYVTWIGIIFAFTGLIWGFEWFAKSTYTIASGGKEFIPYYSPSSDTLYKKNPELSPIDKIWLKIIQKYSVAEIIEIHIPDNMSAPIAVSINPDEQTYWKTDYRYFDQYTLKELKVNHIWNRYDEASAADKLMRMNYDIHTGGILGLSGKIIAFFGSLIIASLPVTGFLVWWGRIRKSTNKYEI